MRKILTVVRVRGEWLNTDDCTVRVYEVNGDGALPMSDRASQWLRTAISEWTGDRIGRPDGRIGGTHDGVSIINKKSRHRAGYKSSLQHIE